eukprot:Cvel_4348.t1-p1 / transcript=Cvel_4348.t1 / gene=Cvel_4348 / organism=Chromera_velia_CCMP2878 / gene_product=hypothetical protein / transcript_product=hypothetical protein / location=Cvel_scaffold188:94233-94481(-) / protein_length=83 / sequence_SO=supercontig / SO=protein_coding / is_pseudo=false
MGEVLQGGSPVGGFPPSIGGPGQTPRMGPMGTGQPLALLDPLLGTTTSPVHSPPSIDGETQIGETTQQQTEREGASALNGGAS